MPLSNPTSQGRGAARGRARAGPTAGRWSPPAARSPRSSYDGVTYQIAQANNALVFPGLGLGVTVARAQPDQRPHDRRRGRRGRRGCPTPPGPGAPLLPPVSDLRPVSAAVAIAVAQAAADEGLAQVRARRPDPAGPPGHVAPGVPAPRDQARLGRVRLAEHPSRPAARREGCRLFGGTCRFRGCPFVLWVTIPDKEGTMKYVLLIYQGTSPRRTGRALGGGAEAGLRRLPGDQPDARRHPGLPMGLPENATTVRVEDGRTLTTDGPFVEIKEAVGGYARPRGRRPRRGDRGGRADPGGPPGRRGRDPPDRGVLVAAARAGLPRRVGPRPGHPDRLPRRLRPRRGGRAGGVRRSPPSAGRATACPTTRGAWLMTTARNRAIDRIRRDRTLAAEDPAARAAEAAEDDDGRRPTFPDERLELDLHLLPPGAGHRGAGRAHAAHARRADHRRDRPRLPRARGDDGPAAGAGQAQDQGGRDPVPGAARRTCCPTGSPPCWRSST